MQTVAARPARRPAALRARPSITRSRFGPEPLSPVRQLQRVVGNHAMSRVLRSMTFRSGAATHVQREVDVAPRPTIRIGARGPVVAELQGLLNSAGAAPPLVVDGAFGPMTQAEVVRFQATRGLT